ncbi:MAG: undecaprenyl-diphosphate phosphatase [Gemmatimonadetes bacterium]|nr:undecaprenyl-diphosphate phosphatase [Gemmatimonadota bacterium]
MNEPVGVGIAALLGLIQGLTEFLPVSSSGHLALAQDLLGVPGGGIAFAVLLHAGTLLAIFLVFREGVWRLIRGGFSLLGSLFRPSRWSEDAHLAAAVVIATIPGALVGLFLESRIEAAFESTRVVALLLFVTAILLFSTRRARGERPVTLRDAAIIGVAQACAILPGISRSGATIATALLLGIARPRAAEFSFLAAIPLILGSVVLELPDLIRSGQDGGVASLVVGFVVSALVGWAALTWLVKLVRQGALHWFAGYCVAVGALALWLTRGA